jgi:hypothetical protein
MISKHISIEEATLSPTALRFKIDNTPSEEILSAMKLVAEKCFEPLREWYGKSIKINSFYRCDALNKKVKGSKTSQHVKGEAIDLSAGSKTENKKLFDWLKVNVEFDQLINEYDYTWVHVSYSKLGNRKKLLVIT